MNERLGETASTLGQQSTGDTQQKLLQFNNAIVKGMQMLSLHTIAKGSYRSLIVEIEVNLSAATEFGSRISQRLIHEAAKGWRGRHIKSVQHHQDGPRCLIAAKRFRHGVSVLFLHNVSKS